MKTNLSCSVNDIKFSTMTHIPHYKFEYYNTKKDTINDIFPMYNTNEYFKSALKVVTDLNKIKIDGRLDIEESYKTRVKIELDNIKKKKEQDRLEEIRNAEKNKRLEELNNAVESKTKLYTKNDKSEDDTTYKVVDDVKTQKLKEAKKKILDTVIEEESISKLVKPKKKKTIIEEESEIDLLKSKLGKKEIVETEAIDIIEKELDSELETILNGKTKTIKSKKKKCLRYVDCALKDDRQFQKNTETLYSKYKEDYSFVKGWTLPEQRKPLCKPVKDCNICPTNTAGIPNSIDLEKISSNELGEEIENQIIYEEDEMSKDIPNCPFNSCNKCDDSNQYMSFNKAYKDELLEKYRIKK